MFSEADLVSISAIQHYVFCPRQCALIHIEQQWHENRWTAEGRLLHERADMPKRDARGAQVITRRVHIRSLVHGITGFADIVEYHRVSTADNAVALSGREQLWMPRPVEYKRGKPKADKSDEMQLCAQVLCLEEMHNIRIDEGFLFYGSIRRRHSVAMTQTLREQTIATIAALQKMLAQTALPSAIAGPHCRSCSLEDICLPDISSAALASRYWQRFYGLEK